MSLSRPEFAEPFLLERRASAAATLALTLTDSASYISLSSPPFTPSLLRPFFGLSCSPPLVATMSLPAGVILTAPRSVTVAPPPPPDSSPVGAGMARVHTLFSAVSAGTELLAYKGAMPSDIPADATFAHAAAAFVYPSTVGYCNVGRVEEVGPPTGAMRAVSPGAGATGGGVDSTGVAGDPGHASVSVGDLVFAFQPHVYTYTAPVTDLQRLPPGVSPVHATMLPTVETALSLLMDGAPLLGDVIAVVGQGTVGLLTAAVCRLAYPLCPLLTVEAEPHRRAASAAWVRPTGAVGTPAEALVAAAGRRADVVIEVTGAGGGLDAAVELAADSGRVVLGSWYGAGPLVLRGLGGRFHRSHVTLVASQVSSLPATLDGRWSKGRRLGLAWAVLGRLDWTGFAVETAYVADAPRVYERLAMGGGVVGQVVLAYPPGVGQ